MYSILLTIHSLWRWLVLISLVYSIYRFYDGWFSTKPFSRFDDVVSHTTAWVCYIQFIIGIGLYFISPVVRFFLNNFSEAVHERDIRFFGIEHSTMMFIAIAIISTVSGRAKRNPMAKQKFKILAIGFTIALLIIFLSIPWGFSSFTSRPYFRTF